MSPDYEKSESPPATTATFATKSSQDAPAGAAEGGKSQFVANVADVARGTIAPRAIPRRPIDPWGDGVAASSLSGRDQGYFATSTRACER